MIRKLTDLDLKGKRVLIREDLNVPIEDGSITNDKRIRAALPTIEYAADSGALVMIMSHLGRPDEGSPEEKYSLAPIAAHLSDLLGKPVRLVADWLDGIDAAPGDVVLCENVRFNVGEKACDEALSRRMAALCDIFVMDAFGTAHRAQASTYGVGLHAPVACAGPLLTGELEALAKSLDNPARPMLAIVGGSKVSTKLEVLEVLAQRVDQLIVGGGIANTFIAAVGHPVGKSLYEPDLLDTARQLIDDAKVAGGEIPVPVDVVVAKEFAADAEGVIKPASQVADDEMILDVGPETAKMFVALAEEAGTVVWNGPLGVFEFDQFGNGTRTLGMAIARSRSFSIAGGGDTIAAVDKYGIAEDISYISTGGGAFLEFLEGKRLPAVEMLERRGGE